MSIKLLLLKSGEDVIADVKEMMVGDENDPKVVGYFLDKPCVVKMRPSEQSPQEEPEKAEQKASFQLAFYPWMPLTKNKLIPISLDWVITMVDPIDQLYDMYVEEVVNYGKDDQNTGIAEQSDSDQ